MGPRKFVSVAILGVFALLVAAATVPSAPAASGGTVVSATVPSATEIVPDDCLPLVADVTLLGTILPGDGDITGDDCTIGFGSSNDSSMLLLARSGPGSTGMYRLPTGEPDLSWGGDGVLEFPANEWLTDGVLMDDGDLIVVSEDTNGGVDFQFRRYDPDGTVVAALETGTPGSGDNMPFAVRPLASGGFAVAGSAGFNCCWDHEFQVHRFDAANALDPGFSDDGMWSDARPGMQFALDVHEQPDGMLVVGGYDQSDWTLFRLTTAGIPDPDFGTAGYSTHSLTAGVDTLMGLALQDDGGIVAVGTAGTGSDLAVARFTVDGDLDPSFGTGGVTTIPASVDFAGSFQSGADIALQPDGSIVIAGHDQVGGDRDVLVARLEPDGDMDPSFGTSGITMVDVVPGDHDTAKSLAIERSGLIYVAARRWSDDVMYGLRLDANGDLDDSFDDDGIVTLLGVEGQTYSGDEFHSASHVVTDLDGGAWFIGGTATERLETATQADYDDGTSDWDVGASGAFGVCLRDISGSAALDVSTWGRDTVDQDCEDGVVDPWRPVPADIDDAEAKVAEEGAASNGFVHLRFGLRVADDQEPGTYVAPILLEVRAPAT